mmetsp:Transcript_4722/g.6486  ORF Transcript_4722/g.6486 Transcript_4722/m.6486 type:complete len:80 (+) Transcript_4722:682-921(+)
MGHQKVNTDGTLSKIWPNSCNSITWPSNYIHQIFLVMHDGEDYMASKKYKSISAHIIRPSNEARPSSIIQQLEEHQTES